MCDGWRRLVCDETGQQCRDVIDYGTLALTLSKSIGLHSFFCPPPFRCFDF